METSSHPRAYRGRGGGNLDNTRGRGGAIHRNKQWTGENTTQNSRDSTISPRPTDGERWEKNGERRGPPETYRGRGTARGRGIPRGAPRIYHNATLRAPRTQSSTPVHEAEPEHEEMQEEEVDELVEDVVPVETSPAVERPFEERERLYHQLKQAREGERARAIAEGKMDDPAVSKRLEDAINVVGTCMEMCPSYEKHRRDLQGPVDLWERIPGTRRMDFSKAVKMYQRAPGDTTLPSDIRPPLVLRKTLDYLFHTLGPTSGFAETISFVRDRARAVRTDFTLQHESGPLAIECHDRCVRMHIVALHIMRGTPDYQMHLEDQQLANCLQSLKEFYDEQRGQYESPNELEMWVYSRLIHIRDQKERHENVPTHLQEHPVFKLVTKFRAHVQLASAPITKTSALVVDDGAMEIFGELAQELRDQGSGVMIYLTACLLEKLFGPDRIDDIEGLRNGLTIPEIIDGVSTHAEDGDYHEDEVVGEEEYYEEDGGEEEEESQARDREDSFVSAVSTDSTASEVAAPQPVSAFTSTSPFASVASPFASTFGSSTAPSSNVGLGVNLGAFAGTRTSAFSGASPAFGLTPKSAFGNTNGSAFPPSKPVSAFGQTPSPPIFSTVPVVSTSPPPRSIFSKQLFAPSATTPPLPETSPATTVSSADFGQYASSPLFTNGNSPSPTPSIFSHIFPAKTEVPARPSLADAPALLDVAKRNFADAPPPSSKPMSIFDHVFPPRTEIQPPTIDTSPPPPLPVGLLLNPQAPSFTPSPPKATSPSPSSLKVNGFGSKTSIFQPSPLGSRPPISADTISPISPVDIVGDIGTAAATPPNGHRRVPPTSSLPRLDTSGTSRGILSPGIGSPTVPPLMPKARPIDLPPTTPLASPIKARPSLPHLQHVANPSDSGILSPLYMGTPTHSRPASRLPSFTMVTPQPQASGSAQGKGKGKAREFDVESEDAAWREACRNGDDYHSRAQRERESPKSTEKKRQRAEASAPPKPKRRISERRKPFEPNYVTVPRTDEVLAERLKNNKKAHESRWLKGSFLEVIKAHVPREAVQSKAWLSVNQESDATAIWLQCKLDVPSSGEWASTNVFSIGLSPVESEAESPIVVVFECTPLEGVDDELERKFRVLEDCARLRDIVQEFPSKRRYVPSLLTIHWFDGKGLEESAEFTSMVAKLVSSGTLQGSATFSMTKDTEDLDTKLLQTLKIISWDFSGKLTESLTLNAMFKVFDPSWINFSTEWIDHSIVNGEVDWPMYGHIIDAAFKILNTQGECVVNAISPAASASSPIKEFVALPPLAFKGVSGSTSMYAAVLSWLSHPTLRTIVGGFARDLQSQRDMGREFSAVLFAKSLRKLTVLRVGSTISGDSRTKHHVPKAEIRVMVEKLDTLVQVQGTKLHQAYTMRATSHRSPPKRRMSVAASEDVHSPTPSKRQRSEALESPRPPTTSPFLRSLAGTNTPPSPLLNSVGDTSGTSSTSISVAMLRALTRDVKMKYSNNAS